MNSCKLNDQYMETSDQCLNSPRLIDWLLYWRFWIYMYSLILVLCGQVFGILRLTQFWNKIKLRYSRPNRWKLPMQYRRKAALGTRKPKIINIFHNAIGILNLVWTVTSDPMKIKFRFLLLWAWYYWGISVPVQSTEYGYPTMPFKLSFLFFMNLLF